VNRSKYDLARDALTAMRRSYSTFLLDAQRAMDAIEIAAGPFAEPTAEDIRVQCIIEIVAAEYQLHAALLLCPIRTVRVAEARHVAMVLCRELLNLSLSDVGDHFRRDHGTVIGAEKNVKNWQAADAEFPLRWSTIKRACIAALAPLKAAS
jgi:chromosomal replication initiation ATPase DnaA